VRKVWAGEREIVQADVLGRVGEGSRGAQRVLRVARSRGARFFLFPVLPLFLYDTAFDTPPRAPYSREDSILHCEGLGRKTGTRRSRRETTTMEKGGGESDCRLSSELDGPLEVVSVVVVDTLRREVAVESLEKRDISLPTQIKEEEGK
jgi:hypothetical protein